MPLSFVSATARADEVKADLLVVPAFKEANGPTLGPGGKEVDAALGGGIEAFMSEAGFEAKAGDVLRVPSGDGLAAKAVLLVGVGEQDKLSTETLRGAAAAAVKGAMRVKTVKTIATTLLAAAPSGIGGGVAAQAVAEGATLGSYQFLRFKKEAERSKLASVQILGKGGAKVKRGLDEGAAIAQAVNWVRDRVNTPAGALTPADLAEEATEMARSSGLKIKVLDEVAIKKHRLGGLAGVGQGSENPPRFVELTYSPPGARATVALVGKGVTFDSGGLSLKTPEGMETMKTDMSGAAAVIGAMSVLKKLGVKAKVIGFAPLVENMPSGKAIRPGDVLEIRNGKTVEVLNTDAEGRLILADALSLAVERKPDAIINLATLTGACMIALGPKYAGLMGNNERWVTQVRDAAHRAGELVWHLPLPEEYRSDLDSEVADLKNVTGGRYGGALTAGLFLKEFVGSVPWVHLDIAGPARSSSDNGYTPKGGTGFGVRTLVELLRNFHKP